MANALEGSDISLVITGSMQPLFIAESPSHTINDDSDAWVNLRDAIIATTEHKGVAVQFYHKLMNAKDTQKSTANIMMPSWAS